MAMASRIWRRFFNSRNVSVLLGNGDGTFRAAPTVVVGQSPFSIAVGDFNGDGKPDLETFLQLQKRLGAAGQWRRDLPGGPDRRRGSKSFLHCRRRLQWRWQAGSGDVSSTPETSRCCWAMATGPSGRPRPSSWVKVLSPLP